MSSSRGKKANGSSLLSNSMTILETGKCKFLIMDAPTDKNLPNYIKEMREHNVRVVVRACEPSYSTDRLKEHGISVIEMSFADGSPPTERILSQWLDLMNEQFGLDNAEKRCIAVHCVAGLGRAPVLVAIGLMERDRMDPLDAVEFIRNKRRGAVNAKQLDWIEHYKPRSASGCCIIS